ncbi:winged helix-turn-helix transcriptional regulator [Cystobacter fuscus]
MGDPLLYRLIINDGPIRFRELQRAARPITQKELTKQLRLLETRGLVHRTVYPEMPPHVEYEATHVARQLLGSLESIAAWMRTHGRSLHSKKPAAPRLTTGHPPAEKSKRSVRTVRAALTQGTVGRPGRAIHRRDWPGK